MPQSPSQKGLPFFKLWFQKHSWKWKDQKRMGVKLWLEWRHSNSGRRQKRQLWMGAFEKGSCKGEPWLLRLILMTAISSLDFNDMTGLVAFNFFFFTNVLLLIHQDNTPRQELQWSLFYNERNEAKTNSFTFLRLDRELVTELAFELRSLTPECTLLAFIHTDSQQWVNKIPSSFMRSSARL